MVNKAAVILLGGIVLVGVLVVGGVGALVLGVGGGGDGGTPTAVDGTPLPFTPTPADSGGDAGAGATDSAPTPTSVQTQTASATTTEVPRTILPRRFDEKRIEVLVARYVNEYREADGLEPLRQNGSTADAVGEMARNHSVRMANEGSVTHEINGNDSTARYYDNELYRTCQWKSGLRNSIVRADNNGPESSNNSLEAIGRTYAGQEYDDGKFNADEEAVARAIVEAWWDDFISEQRMTLPNAGSIGVGVEITQSGEVYATANLCK